MIGVYIEDVGMMDSFIIIGITRVLCETLPTIAAQLVGRQVCGPSQTSLFTKQLVMVTD